MNQFKKKLENYWYHYKWATIITVFFGIALIICMAQCTAKDEYDMYALYAGPCYIGGKESAELKDAVNDYMEADRQNVCTNSFVYVSESKREEYKQNDAYVNVGINMQQTSDFFDFLYSASFNMLILDGELYSLIQKDEILTPIADISDIGGEKSPDGYCVRLYDTTLPQKYSLFSKMPDDTVICFRKKVLLQKAASKNHETAYDYQKSIFKKIIEQ